METTDFQISRLDMNITSTYNNEEYENDEKQIDPKVKKLKCNIDILQWNETVQVLRM